MARLHRVTLRFAADTEYLEPLFWETYFKRSLPHLRRCHWYSIFFYGLAAVIDYFALSGSVGAIFWLRSLVVTAVFLCGYGFTFHRLYERWWQQISVGYLLLTGTGFIVLALSTPGLTSYHCYVGLLVSTVIGYTFIRERFIYASFACTTLAILYVLAAVFFMGLPHLDFIVSVSYLAVVNLLGMLIARHLEASARGNFFLEHQLSHEREKVLDLNKTLEQRVTDRTRELEEAHHSLKEEVAQRKDAERKLAHAHKMEAIGTLAGGVAHDFNNILSAILGYTELSIDKAEGNPKLQEYLEEIRIAGERARNLIKQILVFARQSEEQVFPLKMSTVVKEALELLRSFIPATIEIRRDIQSSSYIQGDPVSVHQILINLCTNAAHAMDQKGTLTIRLSDETIPPEGLASSSKLAPGRYVKLTVSDTGSGIPPEITETIFEPYFTTKSIGEGTGMGLAMVHGIVTKYKGEITFETRVGEGTTFTVLLPATDEKAVSPNTPREALPHGTGHILLVDDEPAVAAATGQTLGKLGYEVEAFTNSTEAFRAFREHGETIDLVITDMTMPGMDGEQLARSIFEIRPSTPIIICTGYTDKLSEESAREMGVRSMLNKPISRETLAHEVSGALHEPKAQ